MAVIPTMQNDWNNYFATAKPGDTQTHMGGGLLTRNADGTATYKATNGQTSVFAANSNLDAIAAANPEVATAWEKHYGYKLPTQGQVPSITSASVTPAIQDPTKGTVAGQMDTITAKDSALMQRAAQKGLDLANSRGLLNSGMAIQSAQNAVYDAALPIAQADAGSNNQFALTNAAEANTTNRFNAGEANKVGMFNAGETNTTSRQSADIGNRTLLANLDAQTRTTLANLDATNRKELANIQASYQNQIQTSQDAAKLWSAHMDEIYKINADTNITDPNARANLVAGSLQRAKDGMNLLSAISNINIGAVLA